MGVLYIFLRCESFAKFEFSLYSQVYIHGCSQCFLISLKILNKKHYVCRYSISSVYVKCENCEQKYSAKMSCSTRTLNRTSNRTHSEYLYTQLRSICLNCHELFPFINPNSRNLHKICFMYVKKIGFYLFSKSRVRILGVCLWDKGVMIHFPDI